MEELLLGINHCQGLGVSFQTDLTQSLWCQGSEVSADDSAPASDRTKGGKNTTETGSGRRGRDRVNEIIEIGLKRLQQKHFYKQKYIHSPSAHMSNTRTGFEQRPQHRG